MSTSATVTPEPLTKISLAQRWNTPLRWLAAAPFLLWAFFYIGSTACAIVHFAFPSPMFDQWRMYQSLLTLPFPDNVLALENGHRPIIPNLIRYAEVKWFGANQILQMSIGWASAASAFLLLAVGGWRDRTLNVPARACSVMLAAIGIFWLGNARMLMHGNEALHAYLLVASVVVAAHCTYRSALTDSASWMTAAATACGIAMFCFGPGVASFPAVIALGVALRIRWRRLLIPLTFAVALVLIYLFALPGDNDVRQALTIHPINSFVVATRFIAAPWAVNWLGLADPPLYPSVATTLAKHPASNLLVASAGAVQTMSGLAWRDLAALVGLAGCMAFIGCALGLFRRKHISYLQALAAMLCLFGIGTAAVVSIGRLSYFASNPDQVFADRYLIWPCLFWTGLMLLLVSITRRRAQSVVLIAAALFPLALLSAHSESAGWSGVVHRTSERVAASAISGVLDREAVEGNAQSIDEYMTTLALFKQHDLAMFADPSSHLLGQPWTGTVDTATGLDVEASWQDETHVRGVVRHGIGKLRHQGRFAILDDRTVIVGFANLSFFDKHGATRGLRISREQGFDGYVAADRNRGPLRLVWIEPQRGHALLAARLPPQPSAQTDSAGTRVLE